MKVVTAWLNNNDARCQLAQRRMLRSVLDHGLDPVIVNGTPRPFLGDMLKLARSLSPAGGNFMWLNSDCELTLSRAHWENNIMIECVTGLHRIESADGSICDGVDGYIFPCELWDKYYAHDIPEMYVGGTHVDWWLTRLAQKHGVYSAIVGLNHISHERSETSRGTDRCGVDNLREFSVWAKRNGVSEDYE